MTSQQLSVRVAISSMKLAVERTDKFFSSLPEDQLSKEVVPGKNRSIYLWGHLTAIHDAMFAILGLGPRLHPELAAMFVSSPDKAPETSVCWRAERILERSKRQAASAV